MSKTRLDEFIEYLNSCVGNAIYIWGGQTQVIKDGIVYKDDTFKKQLGEAEAWIRKTETSTKNAERALKLYNKVKGTGRVLRTVDCSGLGMNWLYNKKKLASGDMTANGMKGKCTKIDKSLLCKGDWVFRVYKSGSDKGRAYHIGYVVDNNLNVVESRGRDHGVVKKPFDSSYWNYYGRPSFFENDIADTETYVTLFNRVLKKTTPMMSGDDVRALQILLNEATGLDLAVDGKLGNKTANAIEKFQKEKGLVVDGKAGEKTIEALGGTWVGEVMIFKRILKKSSPLMEGDDVVALQMLLNEENKAGLKVDGKFGTKTDKAVRAFQEAKKLKVDGKAGKNTITALGGLWIS